MLLIGFSDGLGVIADSQGSCVVKRIRLADDAVEVRSIEFFDDIVWIGTAFHGVMAIGVDELGHNPAIMYRSIDHPPGRNDIVKWGDRLFGYSSFGLYDVELSDGNILTSPINGPLQTLTDISVAEYVGDS